MKQARRPLVFVCGADVMQLVDHRNVAGQCRQATFKILLELHIRAPRSGKLQRRDEFIASA